MTDKELALLYKEYSDLYAAGWLSFYPENQGVKAFAEYLSKVLDPEYSDPDTEIFSGWKEDIPRLRRAYDIAVEMNPRITKSSREDIIVHLNREPLRKSTECDMPIGKVILRSLEDRMSSPILFEDVNGLRFTWFIEETNCEECRLETLLAQERRRKFKETQRGETP